MKYIDMHLHMEDYFIKELNPNIIYFANCIDLLTFNRTTEKFKDFDNINISFGIHPAFVSECKLDEKQIEKLFKENVFVGEIGLDFCWVEDKSTYSRQIEFFDLQLKLVKKLNNIPMIHTKGGEEEVLHYLKKYSIKSSVIHWYSGPINLIKEYLDLGAYFTIGPDILTGSKIYKEIPLNRLFLETDNPTGMPWIIDKNYNKSNRSTDIIILYKKLAELLDISEEELKVTIYNNLVNIKQTFCI